MDSLHPSTHTRTLLLTLIILTGFPSSKTQQKNINVKTGESIPCHCLSDVLSNVAFQYVVLENQLCLHKDLLGAKKTLEYKNTAHVTKTKLQRRQKQRKGCQRNHATARLSKQTSNLFSNHFIIPQPLPLLHAARNMIIGSLTPLVRSAISSCGVGVGGKAEFYVKTLQTLLDF